MKKKYRIHKDLEKRNRNKSNKILSKEITRKRDILKRLIIYYAIKA
ncbi:hypothetical protein HYE03_02245 [Mycoplasmopsis bovis]|nr:hypothetical protein [Mycoplasmopsis bovis]QQH28070.1 hypothetical protein HYE03_02245 [Mycoplasmopsis bovis]